MSFRFAAAVGILTAISLMAISLEKQNLALRRAVSWQHYQLQRLEEKRCRAVLLSQELGSPARLREEWERTHRPQQALEAPRRPQ